MLNVGFISYLNAYPFFYPFQQGLFQNEAWDFTLAHPAVLNKKLRDGALDISLISSMEYATNQELYELVPAVALSSKGYVDSVRLVSQKPLSELHGGRIALTSASASSVAVTKIVLAEYGVSESDMTTYPVSEGIPDDVDAALSIGDEALLECQKHFAYSYDLGEVWKELFGRNVVFAIAALRRDCIAEKFPLLSSFVERLQRATQLSMNDQEFPPNCRRHYTDIEKPMEYLKLLDYTMTDVTRDDLQFFFDKAYEHKLLAKPVRLKFFSSQSEVC